MKIVMLGPKDLIDELSPDHASTLVYVEAVEEFLNHAGADAYFDLLFQDSAERKQILSKLLPKPVFISSVIHTLAETGNSFIRINGWRTFLKRNLIEASSTADLLKSNAARIGAALNKTIEWVPDIPGFVSARVVSMIINEAYFALQENVSTKAEIDIAMQLGTNYPYGPFEWSEKIGLNNIHDLLMELSKKNSRYQPAALLTKEATR